MGSKGGETGSSIIWIRIGIQIWFSLQNIARILNHVSCHSLLLAPHSTQKSNPIRTSSSCSTTVLDLNDSWCGSQLSGVSCVLSVSFSTLLLSLRWWGRVSSSFFPNVLKVIGHQSLLFVSVFVIIFWLVRSCFIITQCLQVCQVSQVFMKVFFELVSVFLWSSNRKHCQRHNGPRNWLRDLD